MYKRSEKVSEAIHEIVSELILKGLKDPRIGFVTITDVKVTDDLHHATIFFTVIGTDEEKAASEKGLNSARGFVRKELGSRLRMRYVPELAFKYDASVEYGQRIDHILQELQTQNNGTDDT